MSTAVEPMTDSEFAKAAKPLLLNYAAKLRELTEQILEFRKRLSDNNSHKSLTEYGKALRDEFVQRFNYLKAPSEELARQVSAVVEQGRIEGLEKVELWLQLAEFEHYLNFARRLTPNLAALK